MADKLEEQVKAAETEWLEGWKAGPQRTRWSKIPLQVGDTAPNAKLPDQSGNEVSLKDMWKEHPLLLLFWRHYGCSCGVDRAKLLQDEFDDYVSAGANVVIVGQGEPERAAAYAEKYGLPAVSVLCDPEFEVYHAYDIIEGKPSQIMFDAPDEYLKRVYEAGVELADARRAEDRPLVDNTWLLPAEFVIDTDGVVRLAYRYNYCEDFPDHRVLVAAIREATGEL